MPWPPNHTVKGITEVCRMGTVSVLSLPRGAIMESVVQITTDIISPLPPQSSTAAETNDETVWT